MESWPRSIGYWMIALMAVGWTAAVCESAGTNPRPPNVILIYTDDQGSIDANCYGATDLVARLKKLHEQWGQQVQEP